MFIIVCAYNNVFKPIRESLAPKYLTVESRVPIYPAPNCLKPNRQELKCPFAKQSSRA